MRRIVRNAKREEIEKIKGGRIKQGGVHRGYNWVCISMPAAARPHRPSLMKYFCSQSSNRGYWPSTSLALILLSSVFLFSLSSCNSSHPSGLSSLRVSSVFPSFTVSSIRLCCSPSLLSLGLSSASVHHHCPVCLTPQFACPRSVSSVRLLPLWFNSCFKCF